MDKVYFLKDFQKLSLVVEKILIPFYSGASELLVKIHFGEIGNKTAFTPADITPIAEVFKKAKISLTFLDTPVMYHSPRNNPLSYKMMAKLKGWDKLGRILISNRYQTFKTKNFQVQVSLDLIEAKNVLVISHVKGHPCAGFGGAIKNLGMGGVSKETKKIEHELGKPHFVKECQCCGLCAQFCPGQAIKMINNKACFDLNRCLGCSICEIVCPYHCLAPEQAIFDDLLSQGAVAVINHLSQKTFYLNIIKKVSRLCDCFAQTSHLIAPDLGVLFSENPLAIDQASLDLLKQKTGQDVFQEAHHKDPALQIKFAAKHSRLKPEYQLVEI